MATILPNTIAINSAIGNENGFLTFYESTNLLDANDVGLVSSLVADETQRWRNAGIGFTEYQVECFTWESFRDKFHLKSQNFDIISIDIEGMDYDVLIQMNLNELGCKILCVEFNGVNKNKYVEYANKFNLHLVNENAENLIFSI
jgi:FkbM family methyltransferase